MLPGGNFALVYQELMTADHTWINGDAGEEIQLEICASWRSYVILMHFWTLGKDLEIMGTAQMSLLCVAGNAQ